MAVAWFGGSYESHGDVAIWLGMKTDSEEGAWEYPIKIADEPDVPHWNPVLSRGTDGAIHLFYKVGSNARDWRTRTKVSRDEGRSWSSYRELPLLDGFTAGPVKDKPIVLSDGSWLAPTSRETETEWDAAVTLSKDDGDTWELGGPVPLDHAAVEGKGIIQPTLWESDSGSVHMLLRSDAGNIYRSDSMDSGKTWCGAYPTSLPNNNSGIDLDRLSNGSLVLCYNPVDLSWGKRTPLALSISEDNGTSWDTSIILEDEDPPTDEERVKLDRANRPNEFSYPAILALGNRIHVTYTWKRQRICYRILEIEEDA